MTTESMPLLIADDVCISVDGEVVIDRMTLCSEGQRVLVLGDAVPLFSALTRIPRAALRPPRGGEEAEPIGDAVVARGSLFVAGRNVARGAHMAFVGAAPLDPPLPQAWTAVEYVAWGARLSGLGRGARDLAISTLERLGLGPLRGRTLGSLALPERRVLALAQAIVGGPEVLVAEAPLAGLSSPASDFVLHALGAATVDRGAIVSAHRIDPTTGDSILVRTASYVVWIAGGEVILEGPPAEVLSRGSLFVISVSNNVEALRGELEKRGAELRGGPTRFSVALAEGQSSREILAAAHVARAPLIELQPLVV